MLVIGYILNLYVVGTGVCLFLLCVLDKADHTVTLSFLVHAKPSIVSYRIVCFQTR